MPIPLRRLSRTHLWCVRRTTTRQTTEHNPKRLVLTLPPPLVRVALTHHLHHTTAIAAAARTSTASTPCPGCAHRLLRWASTVGPCRLGHAAPPPPRAAREVGRSGGPTPNISSLRCAWRSVDRPETESRTRQTRGAGRSSETPLASTFNFAQGGGGGGGGGTLDFF